jgi:hypothetical protein
VDAVVRKVAASTNEAEPEEKPLSDQFPKPDDWKPKFGKRMLDVDARVDSFM